MNALTEIVGFLHDQSRISEKNIERLRELSSWKDRDVSEPATVMLEVARVAPGKRRRLRLIRSSRPEVWKRLIEVGLIGPETSEDGFRATLGAGLSPEHLRHEGFEDDEPF